MANYVESYRKVMKHEGGYSNDPDDRGGETYKGVARNFYPDWDGWKIIDILKNTSDGNYEAFLNGMKNSYKLNDMVVMFYKPKYWDKFRGDDIQSQAIADEMLDIAVNMGVSTANKFLQIALNVLNRNQKIYNNIDTDGIVGNKTISTLNTFMDKSGDIKFLIKILNILQGNRYIDIMLRDESQEKYCRGWLNRVEFVKH